MMYAAFSRCFNPSTGLILFEAAFAGHSKYGQILPFASHKGPGFATDWIDYR